MYLVSGGGGGELDSERVANWAHYTVEYSRYHYSLMEVNGNLLSWQAFDDQNQLIDMFTLTSRVPQVSLEFAGGAVPLSLNGKPGTSYAIEASADLESWQPFKTNSVPASGTVIIDLEPSLERQFFRARALP